MEMLISKLNLFSAVQRKLTHSIKKLMQGWWRSGLLILLATGETFSYLGPLYLEQLFSKQFHNLNESYHTNACHDPAMISKLEA